MEKIFLKLIELLESAVGEWGVWGIVALIILFLVFLAYERFNKTIIASSSNNFKKFELFLKVFDGEIENKSPIVLEQGFSNYFGYSLSFDEIEYCFNLNRPTAFINDLLKSKYLIRFENGCYIETVKLELRKYIASAIYWVTSIIGLALFVFLISTNNFAWLILSLLSFTFAGVSLKFVGSSYAASRVISDHYKKRKGQPLILLSK